MHPGMMYWWQQARRRAACGDWAAFAAHGPTWAWERREAAAGEAGEGPGSALGVRRPLRFLAYKLGLDEDQVAELAKILGELKTERAQADVDGRRTVSAFADAVGSESFDEARASDGGALRVQSAERLRDAVLRALRRIHAVLSKEQRAKLAYLIRTGAISI